MDWPTVTLPTPEALFSLHPDSYGWGGAVSVLTAATSAVFAANEVLYYPFVIRQPSTAVKMTYIVGATAAGNVDLGIYDSQGNRLVNSGSTAQGTINTIQEVDIADTLLLPGLYYMAITGSSATGTCFQASNSDELIVPGQPALFAETTGGFGLPATATFAPNTASTPKYLIPMSVHFSTLV